MPILQQRTSSVHPILKGIFLIMFAATGLGTLTVLWMSKHGRDPVSHQSGLTTYGTVAEFTLTESAGREFSSRDLEGHVWIADFMFTNCPGQCPRLASEMSRLQKRLPPEVRFVSFTADPARDTPQVLSEYARNYGAEKERWFFLTGSTETLNRVASSFSMSRIDDPNSHSLRLVLVDKRGKVRGYYDATESQSMDQIAAHAKILSAARSAKPPVWRGVPQV